ncbi:MAG TPA: hypothetical protein VEQ65_08770, partial [Opitutus sp.]|nr:hypothetical protein [Opitutus sp.]
LRQAISRGEVDVFRDTLAQVGAWNGFAGVQTTRDGANLQTTNLRAAGPLLRLSDGEVTAALGLGWERNVVSEGAEQLRFQPPPAGTALPPIFWSGLDRLDVLPAFSQQNFGGYAEIHVPLVGEARGFPGMRQLDVQAAGRRDRWSVENIAG